MLSTTFYSSQSHAQNNIACYHPYQIPIYDLNLPWHCVVPLVCRGPYDSEVPTLETYAHRLSAIVRRHVSEIFIAYDQWKYLVGIHGKK